MLPRISYIYNFINKSWFTVSIYQDLNIVLREGYCGDNESDCGAITDAGVVSAINAIAIASIVNTVEFCIANNIMT